MPISSIFLACVIGVMNQRPALKPTAGGKCPSRRWIEACAAMVPVQISVRQSLLPMPTALVFLVPLILDSAQGHQG